MNANDPEMTAVPEGPLTAVMRNAGTGAGLRPVDQWNPPYCGDIGLKIRRDGSWLYRDSPIERPALVKLFAGILRKDLDGSTYLVTPVEKILVTVEDAPFLAVAMDVTGAGADQILQFHTNTGDVVTAGPAHPIRFQSSGPNGELKPYVRVRGRLDALLTRAVFAELANLVEDDGPGQHAIVSGGVRFAVSASAPDAL